MCPIKSHGSVNHWFFYSLSEGEKTMQASAVRIVGLGKPSKLTADIKPQGPHSVY